VAGTGPAVGAGAELGVVVLAGFAAQDLGGWGEGVAAVAEQVDAFAQATDPSGQVDLPGGGGGEAVPVVASVWGDNCGGDTRVTVLD
jgi:hypothetical protein